MRFLTFNSECVVGRVTALVGPPTHSVDAQRPAWWWTLGGSVLYVITSTEDDSRSHVSTYRADERHRQFWASDKFRANESAGGLGATIDRWLANAAVDLGDDLSLKIFDSGVPYVLMGPRTYDPIRAVPDALVNLAIGCLRGDVEPAMFLDAIKHDTDILEVRS